jgi:hypothetical protein
MINKLVGYLFWMPLIVLFCLLNPGAVSAVPFFGGRK